MSRKTWRGVWGLALVAGVLLAGARLASASIVIDTVPVGNPGNAADTADGDIFAPGTQNYGAVGYAYNIGKYEVTAGQYTAFLNAVAATDTYALYSTNQALTTFGSGIARSGSSGSYTYTVDANFVNRPVNYVSFGDAMRFANWLHNGQPTGAQNASTTEDGAYFVNGATSNAALLAVTRKTGWQWAVTSEDEWYKAAYHDPVNAGADAGGTTDYWLYPTQSDTAPGQDMADVSGNNANYYTSPFTYPIDSPRYTTLVGEFQSSDSQYGTFDQGGNVWEWNEAIIWSGSDRGLRGGSFSLDGCDCYLQSGSRDYGYPTFESLYIGFRVS